MTAKIAINGFGRIGRLVLRSIIESGRSDISVVGINDLATSEANAHLLKYDSVHGRFNGEIRVNGDMLIVNDHKILMTRIKDPSQLPWKALNVDVAMECTGIFSKKEDAMKHIEAGAKKVLISAPTNDADIMVVYGVNHNKLLANHLIVSNASCTTNALAPVAFALNNAIGIKNGFMTTIHSYTGDQKTVDTMHKDLHRARTAAINMIPTSTGAAKAVGNVLPEMKGKLDGVSIRVPTANVSVIDFKFTASHPTTVEEVNKAIMEAADGHLKNILGYYTEPLVSSDFNHDPRSSIFAINETKVIDETFVRVMSWYDNEWGFSNRMSDTAALMSNLK